VSVDDRPVRVSRMNMYTEATQRANFERATLLDQIAELDRMSRDAAKIRDEVIASYITVGHSRKMLQQRLGISSRRITSLMKSVRS